MRWTLGALAVAAFSLVFVFSRWVHAGILAYHAVCLGGILLHWKRVRPLFARPPGVGAWTLWTTVVILAGLFAPLLFWDPRTVRDEAAVALFPWQDRTLTFFLFAAYTLLVHASLEEVFWRGAFTDLGRARPAAVLAGNAIGFYLVHVVALAFALGAVGWLLALPTAGAGLAWGYVTLRTRSLWPALVSHWAADLAILWGMWHFFLRP